MNEQTFLVLVLLDFNLDFKPKYKIRYYVITMPYFFSFVVYFCVGVSCSYNSCKAQEEQGRLGEEITHCGCVGGQCCCSHYNYNCNVGAKKKAERGAPCSCLFCLLKLLLKAINNKAKGGGVATRGYNPRT